MRQAEYDEEFAQFHAAHRPGLVAMLYVRTRNWHDAEDLAQEIFLKVISNWEEFKARTEPQNKVYLYKMANGMAIDQVRAGERLKKARKAAEQQARAVGESYEPPGPDMSRDGFRWLETLTDQRKRIAFCYFWVGMTAAEIAKVLGISESTVRSHKDQIMKGARAALGMTAEEPRKGTAADIRASALINFVGDKKQGGAR
jgi:RNA polymerase sigma-70 factor, ECF subfamily